jgi:transcription elongation factor GreA
MNMKEANEGVKSMLEEKKHYMTVEGKKKLEEELTYLTTKKRKEVVERIKVARDFGDLSENSEYDAAKDEQAFVESRINQVEKMIRHAVIIEEDQANPDIVSIGKKVKIQELPDGEEEKYMIVGSAESDPLDGKISNDSPMARSLIGRSIGEEVVVSTPGGDVNVKILEVD